MKGKNLTMQHYVGQNNILHVWRHLFHEFLFVYLFIYFFCIDTDAIVTLLRCFVCYISHAFQLRGNPSDTTLNNARLMRDQWRA